MKRKRLLLSLHCGCKVNQYETNAMMQKFINSGYKIVSFEDKADIYIINTCTVTNMSDRKSRQMLRRAKNKNSESVLVAIRLLCASGKRRNRKNRRNRFSARYK